MYKIKFIKNQKHRLKIISEDEVVKQYIKQQFSVPNPSFRFQPHASKDITPISLLWTFPDGLALDIIKSLKNKFGSSIDIDISEVKDIIRPFSYTPEKIIQPENLEFVYRDYQEHGIRLGLKYGRGLYHWATASGKSASMYGLIKNIWNLQNHKSKVLIIVPRTQLVYQLTQDFINYGCDPEEITKFTAKSEYDLSKNIIISNMQFLNNRIDELDTSKIDILIIDECIRAGQKISTINGEKNIEDIKIDDLVYSYNIKENIIEYKKVLNTFKNLYKSNSYNKFIRITLENNTFIDVTPNHKIFTSNRGYIRADELNIEDDILIK